MYSYKNLLISIFLISILSSCASFLLPELHVTNVVYDNTKIVISFSSDVDESSVQKSITLLEDNSAVTGYFVCNAGDVFFYPQNGIKENFDYELSVSTSCEDKKGNSLMNDYHLSFSTRNEHIRPRVISITPNNQDAISNDLEYINIIFSESISRDSFIKSLNVAPVFEYFLDFAPDDNSVKIIPKNPLKLNTDYVITISTELLDLARNSLLEDRRFVFFYNKKNNPPDYTVTVFDSDENEVARLVKDANIQNIPSECSIKFDFEHEMDLSAISAYFYFSPTIDYKITKDEIEGKYVIFNISDAQWNTEYKLTVLEGLPDAYGQRFENVSVYSFTTDNEAFNPPCYIEGIIQTSSWDNSTLNESVDFNYLSEEKNYANVAFSENYVVGTAKKTEAYLIFATSNLSDGIDVYSLRDGLSVTTTNSCCSFVIKTIDKVDLNLIPSKVSMLFNSDISTSERKIDVFHVIFEITNTSKSGEIHIVLDNDIKDTLNNSIDRQYDFVLNK